MRLFSYDPLGRQSTVAQTSRSLITSTYGFASLLLGTETVRYDLDHNGDYEFTRVFDGARDPLTATVAMSWDRQKAAVAEMPGGQLGPLSLSCSRLVGDFVEDVPGFWVPEGLGGGGFYAFGGEVVDVAADEAIDLEVDGFFVRRKGGGGDRGGDRQVR